MAQRKRQTTAGAANQGFAKAAPDRLARSLADPRPPRKRMWFLITTTAALVLWAGFLVAMALR